MTFGAPCPDQKKRHEGDAQKGGGKLEEGVGQGFAR